MRLPLCSPPAFPTGSSSGTKARGHTYERRVGQWLAGQSRGLGCELLDHPWLRAERGICQPDFLLVFPSGCVILVEAKLTECDCAGQLRKYKRALSGFDVVAVQIARRVTSRPTVDCFENITDNGLMLLWV